MSDNIIAKDMQEFINGNRGFLTMWVQEKYPNAPVDDDSLEGYIYNEEQLYKWACLEGVDI